MTEQHLEFSAYCLFDNSSAATITNIYEWLGLFARSQAVSRAWEAARAGKRAKKMRQRGHCGACVTRLFLLLEVGKQKNKKTATSECELRGSALISIPYRKQNRGGFMRRTRARTRQLVATVTAAPASGRAP